MIKQMKTLAALVLVALVTIMSATAAEFKVTPQVGFDVGYTTRANHLGLQFQKNSAFVASTVALSNKIVTPEVGVTYYIRGESAQQAVLDANLSRNIGDGNIVFNLKGGVEKRVIAGAFTDTFTAYGTLRLDKFPVLTKIASPYVTVARDFDTELFGTTVGLDRTFSYRGVSLTPRVEGYFYNKHTSWLAGGELSYTGIKYVTPYVDASYVTSDTTLAARKFEGNFALTTGVRFKF